MTYSDSGVNGTGRFVAYGDTPPSFSIADGKLRITENAPATSTAQYLGVATAFGRCVDATAFSGVQFAISGSVSGCSLMYGTADVEHQDATLGGPYATGAPGSYQPQASISTEQLHKDPQILMYPFVGGTYGGNPATPLDPSQLIFLLWQFDVGPGAANDAPACIADITVSDVKFY